MKIILEKKTDSSLEMVGKPEEVADNRKDVENSEEEITTENGNLNCPVEKELRRQGITLKALVTDNPRLSLDWQPFRAVTQCSCASPINSLTRKYHCWNCGQVFCRSCIDYQTSLPGHYSENKVPVCKICFKKIENEKKPTNKTNTAD